MTGTAGDGNSGAFRWWLRTGRLPPALNPDGLELKFNPWHDPADGRFTFAGAGRHYGGGGDDPASGRRASPGAGRKPAVAKDVGVPAATASRPGVAGARTAGTGTTGAGQAGTPAEDRRMPGRSGAMAAGRGRRERTVPIDRANPVTDFIGGIGESLYDTGRETVADVRAALTTNPVTTVGNVGRGIAGMIDAAIAAEDTPARIQVARAASAAADARRGISAAPQGGLPAMSRWRPRRAQPAAALRRLRMARPRPVFEPPKVDWRRENLTSDEPWKPYNDTATGARDGFAPALTRTMPDGSKRPVKFDGIEGDYVIDRKWKVVNSPRSRAQLLRQMEALEQNHLTGTWEVPNAKQKVKALKLFKKMNATRHKVRVVKP